MARFLPLNLKSYAFGVHRVFEPQRVLMARAGDDFRPPEGYGAGPYTGVEVLDFGSEAPPELALAPEPRRFVEEFRGTTIWTGKPSTEGAATFWWACLNGRYRVSAYDLESLKSALSKPGNLPAILGRFPPVTEIGKDADLVMCLLPRPEDSLSSTRDIVWQRPIPLEATVVTISTASQRLLLWHENKPPSEFSEVLDSWFTKRPPTMAVSGGWVRSEFVLSKGDNVWLLFEVLFGVGIRN